MADPIVHVTNGIPDSGTGNITTLGQTIVDGANPTLGATTDAAIAAGAAGSINAHLRSISRDIVGGVVIQTGANVIGAVTQSGGPWSVSGTVAATQSGTWNINNISGAISLPTGAATAANQPTNAALGSATSGQTGHLGLGAVTTAAPSYTTGQTNALSLTTTGALRTDSSATTQPVSGTLGISGTVAVTQSGTWTVQPGNTANTTPWLMTIQQGGNSATVSAGGALKVDGSAVTQPISAAALPLPSGASTAALQPSNAGQGSTTSGQTGTLSMGAVATSAPTYLNGTSNPVSLTTAGAIRVDASATTQPVSGTVTANQGGTWSTRMQDGSGNAITSDARGSARPLAVEILDASGNQITSFGAGSGPSFGSAFPSTGTAIGAKDSAGVNMQPLNLNASGALKVDGSATTQPVSGTFWQATQPVSGTFWQATQPVSVASLPLPSGASTSALQPTNVAAASATSGQTGTLSFGAVSTSAPTYVNAQSNALSLTTAGALRVDGSGVTQPVSGTVAISGSVAATQSGTWNINNVSGTVSLPTGAATSAGQPTAATLGSTTSGQTGNLALGAVTTAAPTYTTGQTNALSLTTTGALRTDASATTQPVSGTVTASQGGTWTVQPGNTANTTPWLTSIQQGGNTAAVTAASALKVDGSAVTQPISGTVTANQGGNWTSRVVGNTGAVLDFAGQNASSPANSILIGGQFNTSPTTISSGNASPLQLDNAGNLKVNVVAGGAAGGGTSSSFGSAIPAAGTAAGFSDATNMQLARVFDADTGAGTQYVLGALLKKPASGGSVDFGTSSDPIRVDPTGTTTQPVSGSVSITGSVAATQSGTWNITNVSGTVSLPTGAATSANQPSNAALGSTTSGQTGNLALGAVTTAAPAYSTGQSNALSLTTGGALRVDASAATVPVSGTFWQTTQPVSGTVTANQGGTWNITNVSGTVSLPTGASTSANQPSNAGQGSTTSGQTGTLAMGAVTTGNPTYTTAQTSPLSLDTSGALRVNVIAGSGGGGTSSSFGSAFPATGTAIGVKDSAGTNMTFLQVNASNALKVDGSAVTQPVSGTVTANQGGAPWSIKPDGTVWAQTGTSANVNVTNASIAVTGTFWQATQPISAASLPLPTGAATSANQPSNAAIGSTTSGQTGGLAFGATTTGAPTYTTAQSNPLSLTTAGALRVDGSAVTQPVSGTFWQATQPVSGTITANQGGAPWSQNVTQFGGTNISTGTGTGGAGIPRVTVSSDSVVGVSGNVTVVQATSSNLKGQVDPLTASSWGVSTDAAAFTASTTPSNLVGGFFQTTATNNALTNGQAGAWQMTANRAGFVNLRSANGTELGTQFNPVVGTTALNVAGPSNWTSATALNTTFAIDSNNFVDYNTFLGSINSTSTITGGAVTFEESFDNGTNWLAIPAGRLINPATGAQIANPYTLVASTNQPWQVIPGGSTQIRIRLSTVITGTATVSHYFTQKQMADVVGVFQNNAANLLCTASQGGTWNINNVSGAVSLPTGASTSANQPSNAGQGSTTSGQTGTLAMGAVTTGNPTYTTGQTSPLSLDTSGAVRVNVIAGSGGGGTSSSFGSSFPATGTAAGANVVSSAPTYTAGNMNGLTMDTAGNLRVNVVAGGAGGGAVFGPTAVGSAAANPPILVAGTANATATGNVQVAKVSSGGLLSVDASGATVPVSGTFWQTTQPVSGTFWQATQPVSIAATVSVNGAAVTNADAIATNTTSVPSASYGYGFNGTTWDRLQVDGSKNLKVNVSAGALGTTTNATTPNVTTATTWNSSTGLNTTLQVGSGGFQTYPTILGALSQTSTITAGAITFEESFDNGTTYVAIPVGRLINPATGAQLSNPYTLVASTVQPWQIITSGTLSIRLRLSTAITGTGSVAIIPTWAQIANEVQVFQNNAANLKVDISGTAANATAINVAQATSSNLKAQVDPLTATSWGIYAQASTTSGQSGPLVMGAVSTAAPSYTNGQTSPLSLFANGSLRVQGIIAGDTQAGTADSGWPVKIGGVVTTGIPTPLASGQRIDASFDKVGKQLVAGAVRGMKNRSVVSLTTGSAVSIIGAGGSGVYSDVYGVIATNKSATAVTIVFNDGSSTSFTLAVPAGDTRGFMLPVDSAINQVTSNLAWTATMSSAVTSVELTTLYVLNN